MPSPLWCWVEIQHMVERNEEIWHKDDDDDDVFEGEHLKL